VTRRMVTLAMITPSPVAARPAMAATVTVTLTDMKLSGREVHVAFYDRKGFFASRVGP